MTHKLPDSLARLRAANPAEIEPDRGRTELAHATLDRILADRAMPARGSRRLLRNGFGVTMVAAPVLVAVAIAVIAVTLLRHHTPSPGAARPAVNSALGRSERLATSPVVCFFTTSRSSSRFPGADRYLGEAGGSPSGQTPVDYCRHWYALNAHTGRRASGLNFVACRRAQAVVTHGQRVYPAPHIEVFLATGHRDQCRSLGDTPLPRTFHEALGHLHQLVLALGTLGHERDCWSLTLLADDVRHTLSEQSFTGWRVALPPVDSNQLDGDPVGTGGTCAGIGAGNPPGTASALNGTRRTVSLGIGPPTSTTKLLNHLQYELYTHSYLNCYTAESIRALVRRAFATTQMRPRFATTAATPGDQFDPRSERLWNDGCVRFEAAIPANNLRYVDVVLWARKARPLRGRGIYPPATAFRP